MLKGGAFATNDLEGLELVMLALHLLRIRLVYPLIANGNVDAGVTLIQITPKLIVS